MEEYPWEHVLQCTNKKKSSVSGLTAEEYVTGLEEEISCPSCKKELENLEVFYFEHQEAPLVGVGGWMVACLDCKNN